MTTVQTNNSQESRAFKVRLVLIVLSAVFFVWYLIPLAFAGVFNIGNATGLVVSALVFLGALLWRKINGILSRVPSRVSRGLVSAVATVVAIALCVVLVGAELMISACVSPQSDDDATVVVLGCGVNGSNPSLMLQERIDAAIEYLDVHPDAVCVLSGGLGPGEDITEADCMYQCMVDQGVDPARLYRETESTSTVENLEFTKQLIQDEGLNPNIVIVTSEFHEYRAGLVADSLGLEHSPAPAHTALWLLPTFYTRELYGILYQWVQ